MRQAALLCVLALGALTKAMPSHLEHRHPRTVNLAQALNHTVCPIEVRVDINEDRIPRRIKMLLCAPDPDKWCKKQNIPQHECCNHTHDSHQMNCVQMQDTVLVQYKDGRTGTFDVPVGCSCMVEEASSASTLAREAS